MEVDAKMTGDGTQENPFIPDSWEDFVTAVGTRGAFVECVEGTVWDMNIIAPNGVSTLNIYANRIIGNGLTIKNLYLYNYEMYVSSISLNDSAKIYDINFLNITLKNKFMDTWVSSGTLGFYGCVFTFVSLSKTEDAMIALRLYNINCYIEFGKSPYSNKGCSFNTITNDTLFYYNQKYNIQALYSLIKHRGSRLCAAANTNARYMKYNNCLIQGKFTESTVEVSGENTVFDVLAPSISTEAASGAEMLLVNQDKVESSAYMTRVSEAQLNDADYLSSMGFPIGENGWYVAEDGITNEAFRDVKFGAFANATQLSTIRIPPSVKKIGMESFANTQLTSVTIARDCEYYETSFPKGCEINFYD